AYPRAGRPVPDGPRRARHRDARNAARREHHPSPGFGAAPDRVHPALPPGGDPQHPRVHGVATCPVLRDPGDRAAGAPRDRRRDHDRRGRDHRRGPAGRAARPAHARHCAGHRRPDRRRHQRRADRATAVRAAGCGRDGLGTRQGGGIVMYALRPMRRPLMRAPRLLIDWRAGEPFPAGGYTRPSDGLTRGADGVWRPCAPNVPRIEWLDLDGDGMRETPTVLLEPAATNLVLLSQDFSHWAWEKNDGGVVVTPDAGIAPDGTATADLVQDNVASGNTAWMLQTVTGATSAGATYTFSCWLRSASGEPDTVWLGFSDNGGGWQDS